MSLEKHLRHIQYAQGRPIWIAKLSNGESYYQDDNRPGVEQPSAWIRLREKCENESIDIVNFDLQFRKRLVENILPGNAPAYFFVNSIVTDLPTSKTTHAMLFGHLDIETGQFPVVAYRLPDLVRLVDNPRPPEEIKPLCVIANSHGKAAVQQMSFRV